MHLAEGDAIFKESKNISLGVNAGPVEPVQLIVLTIGIVIALFGMGHFVTHQNHGYTLADHEDGECVFDELLAQGVDVRIVCGTFPATVPTVVVIVTVPISFSVSPVMLLIVRKKVG